MAVGSMGTDGQRGVEQQDTLFRPPRQVSRHRHGRPQVISNLLEDVLQRRREGDAFLNREAQPMSLSGLMIGILANDDHLHLVERTEVEGVEDEAGRRVARRLLVLLSDGGRQLLEVRLLELRLQLRLPCGFHLYVHAIFS